MSPEKNDTLPPVTPLDAATVMLLRETPTANPFEVLLMRRHARQRFMAKAFVYPGGQLDETDCDPGLADVANGMTAEAAKQILNEPDLSEETALGLFFAAVRETFEESGVLLAEYTSGKKLDFRDETLRLRFARYRDMILQQEMTLRELAIKEKLFFRLDHLRPYAHWITPEVEQKRFDTRFFLTTIPSGQKPVHDAREMTETLWIEPAKALQKQKDGDILLMPPTLKTLEEMANQSSWSDLAALASSTTIQPIMPQISVEDDSIVIKLPHDPDYTIAELKQPPRPNEMSRVVIRNGRFKALTYEKQ
jgi:8-oxo-dGTP pyrophosphatase MutT (NUDIX family)